MSVKSNRTDADNIMEQARRVLSVEAEQISFLNEKIDHHFVEAVEAIQECKGKLIVCGMGKSGLIGQKISATLSSYGIQSFFLHPADAHHGNLGMVGPEDVVLLISYSGETDEILKLVPFFQKQGNVMIAMTGNTDSSLAQHSDVYLDVGISEEACPLQLAPTSSTTATLVMGDALAVTLMESKGVKEEQFARLHPGGSLGHKLLTNVEDQMIDGEKLPLIGADTSAIDTIHAISDGRLGIVVVTDEQQKLLGIITDGDVRRTTMEEKENFIRLKASQMMTKDPRVIQPGIRVYDAETLMDSLGIHQLVVVNNENRVIGILPYRTQIKR